ncbi:MAG: homoserine O-succinyltransferase [Gammaproteobacteria bacterium]|nr:homoserine O-succinyltransferase [Gammaproteobacteria bacterium]NCF80498.1 homoserine O-succinyltransferase [Pseudomonadota bacterium]
MPISLSEGLPARRILAEEGIEFFTNSDAARWSMRPLRIAVLNLMPDKQATELQLARLLGSTPTPVELCLLTTESYTPTNTSAAHLDAHYRMWEDIRNESIDGLIVTGAPVAHMNFEDVGYWRELCTILSWARLQVPQTLYLCWGALAALYHFHGVPKRNLLAKLFGVFPNRVVEPGASVLNGFQDGFWAPVSRHTEVRSADLPADGGLKVLAESSEAGICLIEDEACRALYMFNHLEYETGTLDAEYRRDLAAGKAIHVPEHYYVDDDPDELPINRWRLYSYLLFSNWIGDIYQRARLGVAEVA